MKQFQFFNEDRKLLAKKLLLLLLYLVAIYLLARFALIGLNDRHKIVNIVPVFLFLLFFVPSRLTFFVIILPLSLFICLFSPISYIYGNIDYQVLISVLATNFSESVEFLQQIDLRVYLKSLLVPLLALFAFWCSQTINIRPWKNKFIVLATLGLLFIFIKPTQFVDNFILAYDKTQENLDELKRYVDSSSWKDVVLTGGGEKDYILILGESVRRDYLHVYGYPVENTPFLDQVDGATIVDGFTSGGVFTVGSLTNMLTLPDEQKWKPRYDLNLIDLMNQANIKTYWLSNQGFIGVFDTPVTSIASRAQNVDFLCRKEGIPKNASDMMLLPLFEERLQEIGSGKRFFVLHTIGSHPDACRRVLDAKEKYEASNSYYDYIACYLTSIRKADLFLEEVYKILGRNKQKTGREFSIIYVSDHGQFHSESGGRLKLHNNSTSKFHYDVPLIKIDSEKKDRLYIKSFKSGLSFTEGISSWVGVTAKGVGKYNLFDGFDDVQDYGLKKVIENINQKPDYAVLDEFELIKSLD